MVGIGASAGGFDAIVELLRALPPDSGMAFIIVQHLSPSPRSLSAELFSHHTSMPVCAAEDGMPLLPNRVYTALADRDLRVNHSRIHLSKPIERRGQRLPVDHLFRSLGQDQHERAIGIILSGTGSDGTLGLRDIVSHGGIVLVQTPESALFDGMPRSAIATGQVAHVLPVPRMPRVLVSYSRHAYVDQRSAPHSAITGTNPAGKILELLQARHGQSFAGYKQGMLIRRIERRMGLLNIGKIDEYHKLLHRDAGELASLHKDLLIGVTEFFRDREAWQSLNSAVLRPLIAAKKPGEPIRAWVAGAATGEEAYSLAILILEQLRRLRKRCPVQVFGTDTNDDALGYARAGVYPIGIASQVRAEYLSRYFVSANGDQHYQVSPLLRESVVFGVHNLLSDPPFSRLDLLSCRNLLIYVEPDVQRRILLLCHFALRPNGRLFLGSAETIGTHEKLYRPVVRKWRIYQRVGSTPHEQIDWHADRIFRSASPLSGVSSSVSSNLAERAANVASVTQKTLLNRFAPAAVLISARMETLYYSGPIDRFLLQRHGAPTVDLLPLLPSGIRAQVAAAVRRAQKTNAVVAITDLPMRRKSVHSAMRVEVIPIPTPPDHMEGARFLVAFEEKPRGSTQRGTHLSGARGTSSKLEDELRATQQDRQNIVEQLEASNEELRASHEETMSINEELQSMNEELGSAKEELQSVNEELNTVNTQLQHKVGEMEGVNNDLRNLLASSEVPTLCLDRSFRIKWFTPAMQHLFNLLPSDVDRPIGDLSITAADPTLMEDARVVLKTLAPRSKELEHQGTYLRRVVPYRTQEEHIEGVVITLADITEAKRAAQQELEAKAAANALLEQRVRERTEELSRLSRDLALAEVRERQTIARDLHDGLGQELNAAVIKLDALRDSNRAGKAASSGLKDIATLMQGVVREMRSLTAQLNPPVLEQLGLVPAIEWLGEEMKRTYSLEVAIDVDHAPKQLNPVIASIVYRAVRELLINVARHAQVPAARVHVWGADDRLKIAVSDQGGGFAVDGVSQNPGAALGLATIRKRIGYIGGVFKIDSHVGHGTAGMIDVPMTPP